MPVTPESSHMSERSRGVDSSYAWLRLVVSVLLGAIGSIGMWAVVVVLPTVQIEFGIDRASASFPYTLTMIGFSLGNVVVGRYVDRIGIMIPIIIAALALGTGFISAAMTTAIWQFAIIQGVLIGIGASATFGPLMANISHWFHHRRGVAVAAVASGNYLAGAVWPPILQWVIEAEGWRNAYIAVGVLCIVVMVPLALLLRDAWPPEAHTTPSDGLGGPTALLPGGFSPQALQIMLIIAGLSCCVAMSMPQVHIVAYAADLGYGVSRGAAMLSLMLAGGVISRILSGFLADSIGGIRTQLLGSVLQCLSLLLYLRFDSLMSLYVVSLIFGLSQGGIVPSYAIVVREYLPAHEAGQRVGLVVMSTLMGMAFGGWLSGWIYDLTGSYQAAFLNGIGWNIFNIIVMSMVWWRVNKPAEVLA